ncbi:hypothetical protein BpHYR1_042432 [Brachionus plicatilis]|uniref:Uncharacterized protein n=1 Tax=Brachionus plicatilis TaxID=10195 RepID=A0A3M7QX20_BRAPC|nr:hypothetical protein BpHYR1_042432 [Brachionus plicatilis]
MFGSDAIGCFNDEKMFLASKEIKIQLPELNIASLLLITKRNLIYSRKRSSQNLFLFDYRTPFATKKLKEKLQFAEKSETSSKHPVMLENSETFFIFDFINSLKTISFVVEYDENADSLVSFISISGSKKSLYKKIFTNKNCLTILFL